MIHEDGRRTLTSIPYLDGEIKIIVAKKDCELGNHYHKIKTEVFTLINGDGLWDIGNDKGILTNGKLPLLVKPNVNHGILFFVPSHLLPAHVLIEPKMPIALAHVVPFARVLILAVMLPNITGNRRPCETNARQVLPRRYRTKITRDGFGMPGVDCAEIFHELLKRTCRPLEPLEF